MKDGLLQYLICPACGGEISLRTDQREESEVISGALECARCQAVYPVRGGIPRFAGEESMQNQRATAENFGAQWQVFDELEEHHEGQFRDWIAPVTPEFIRGRTVIEAGCGKGRHTRALARWGAREVVSVDLSEAVEVAYRNTRNLPNVHIVQADIYRLPLRPIFDYGLSVGVLHHLPDPAGGFAELVEHVRPGGAVSVWVYGRENNGWLVHLVNPWRQYVTSRLPPSILYYLSYLPASLVYVAAKGVYGPLEQTRASRHLFYGDYLGYIARFPFREIHNIVHDHLTAPVAFYLRRGEVDRWVRDARLERVEVAWHNQNSWRAFGFRQPGKPLTSDAG